MKVKSQSEVAQSCPTLRDPMDCSLTGSSVHGIFQARILEWGAIAFSDKHVKNVQIKFNNLVLLNTDQKIKDLKHYVKYPILVDEHCHCSK